MPEHTAFHRPPEEFSDEADLPQIKLAKKQGAAAAEAVGYMINEVAHYGEEQSAGEYFVAYAVEEAEGLYLMRNGKLGWVEPVDENLHVEIAVRDGADGRLVPGLKVFATLIDSNGREAGTHQHPFLWHPCVSHYGRNWQVPGDGEYTIKVRIDPPDFPRHDKRNGLRFTETVEVTFTGVRVQTGRKKSD